MTVTMEVAKVTIQSSVLFSIFHQYQRRSDSCSTRLVGALVGRVTTLEDSFTTGSRFGIELTSCFPVPHSEVGEEISINNDYFRSRLELHKKGHGKELTFLGWYSMQDSNGLPKNTNAEIFSKNSEFIRDYFVREASLSGASIVTHLAATLNDSGHLSYEVTCSEAPKVVHHSNFKLRFVPVPADLGYGMPELQTRKNQYYLPTYVLDDLVNSIARDLFGTQQVPMSDGSSSLPLDSAFNSNIQYRRRLLEASKVLEPSDGEGASQKTEAVLQVLGLSPKAQTENKQFSEDDNALKESLSSLDEKLAQTRAIFMARSFVSL